MHKISFSQWSTGTGGNILSDLRKLQTYLETEFFIWKILGLNGFYMGMHKYHKKK